MLKVENLSKSINGTPIIESINMVVNKGSIYGLVGENGAGKTTILNHIVGYYRGDTGAISIDESPVYENVATKETMFYIPDNLKFYNQYTLKRAESFFRSMYPKWNQELFNVTVAKFKMNKTKRISNMSKGMQKQAVFCIALATMPDYLILDEPIDGLDPIVRKEVWQYIVDAVVDRDMATLISSHNLKEMEGFCDVIGIISQGKMLLEKEIDDLRKGICKIQVAFEKGASFNYDCLNIINRESRGTVDLLIVKNTSKELEKFEVMYKPLIFDIVPLSLEEVFIYEIGGDLNV